MPGESNRPLRARPAEHLVHGLSGPIVILPARVCAYLNRHAGLDEFRIKNRGADAEVDATLIAMRIVALRWQESVTGTKLADPPEPGTELAQSETKWFSTTEAGTLLGVTDRAIRKALGDGRLPGTRVGRNYRINRVDLEHYKAGRVR